MLKKIRSILLDKFPRIANAVGINRDTENLRNAVFTMTNAVGGATTATVHTGYVTIGGGDAWGNTVPGITGSDQINYRVNTLVTDKAPSFEMEPESRFAAEMTLKCEVVMLEDGTKKMTCFMRDSIGDYYPIVELTHNDLNSAEMIGDGPRDLAQGFWRYLFNDSYDKIVDYSNRLAEEIRLTIAECECQGTDERCNRCVRLEQTLKAVPSALSVRIEKAGDMAMTSSNSGLNLYSTSQYVGPAQDGQYLWVNRGNNLGGTNETGGIR